VFVVEDSGLDIRQAALDWFGGLPEGVSYTDCIVMAAANANKTTEVFGFDDVFSKKGYDMLQTRKAA
jgi:predicted nucleic acid-binding protein